MSRAETYEWAPPPEPYDAGVAFMIFAVAVICSFCLGRFTSRP